MESNKINNTYSKSLKGVFIFGGVQLFKILLSVIRSKCSAVFLGPAGYGIYSLLSSTLTIIESLTSCGLGVASVKEIAQADGKDDQDKISRVYKTLNILVWGTGIIGMVLCVMFAPLLSRLAFGNDDYVIAFSVLSVSLILSQLISGQGALIAGLKKYKYIVRLNIITNIASLPITIVMYYIWRTEAIVAVILSTTIINFIFSWYYRSKIKLAPTKRMTIREVLSEGKVMFKMGILINLSYVFVGLSGYILRIFIANVSDEVQVGLFAATFSLVNTYMGLIYSSIEKDFYPRLSTCSLSQSVFHDTLKQQVETVLLLAAPIAITFIVFGAELLELLYSSKFLPAMMFMCWTVVAMYFKAPGSTLAISFLAKGDTKAYFRIQLSFAVYQLILNIVFYSYFGLIGLGISFIISQLIYFLHTLFMCKKLYKYKHPYKINKLFILHSILLIASCLVNIYLDSYIKYSAGILLLILVYVHSFRAINKRIPILKTIKTKFKF